MGEYTERIKNMRWSYSRLSLYDSGCPYAWYLQYLYTDDRGRPLTDQTENLWSAYGSFVHNILERLLKKEIDPDEALMIFERDFDDVLSDFDDEALKTKKFAGGLDYFSMVIDKFDEWMKNIEILEVEGKHDFTYAGYKFTGRIDLLYRDLRTGALVVADHKSAKCVCSKRNPNKILKSEKDKFEGYYKQMALYSLPVWEKYGKPDYLEWNFFNDSRVLRVPFDEDKYHAALDWAVNTIRTIEKDETFVANKQYFFCNKICDFRESCDEKFDN